MYMCVLISAAPLTNQTDLLELLTEVEDFSHLEQVRNMYMYMVPLKCNVTLAKLRVIKKLPGMANVVFVGVHSTRKTINTRE